ncbi:unnamed protein product [Polarella glacialis]|uniref:Uncharacterized protein n=1 Tax=Polarella glacialis TaxID=89957 RepID=A0A813EZD6_POLGL|nr:unnamed protein product [Polarella glacialis]CAE8638356.1 unnamed protein product [Polarella glacialis]
MICISSCSAFSAFTLLDLPPIRITRIRVMAQASTEPSNIDVDVGPAIVQPEPDHRHQLHRQNTDSLVADMEKNRNLVMTKSLCGLCIPVIVIGLDFFAAFNYKYESDHCNSSPLAFSTIFIVLGCQGIACLVIMSGLLYGTLLIANRDMIKANLYQAQGRKEESAAAFERGQVLATSGIRLTMALACPSLLLALFAIAWAITSWVSYANSIYDGNEDCKLPQQWWIGLFVAGIIMNICSGQRKKKAEK